MGARDMRFKKRFVLLGLGGGLALSSSLARFWCEDPSELLTSERELEFA